MRERHKRTDIALCTESAALIILPHIVWQILNDWPFLAFLSGDEITRPSIPPLQFFLNQTLMHHPFTLPIWLLGLASLFFLPQLRSYRFLGIIFALTFLFYMAQEGKDYYVSPVYPIVFASGAIAIEHFAKFDRWGWLRSSTIFALAIGGIILTPLVIPILLPEAYVLYAEFLEVEKPAYLERDSTPLPQFMADRLGWEEMVATVAVRYRGLSEGEQNGCAILSSNWGEAGAIDLFGGAHGLPKALCPNHSYWYWRPASVPDRFFTVGFEREELTSYFDSVRELPSYDCTRLLRSRKPRAPVLLRRFEDPFQRNVVEG